MHAIPQFLTIPLFISILTGGLLLPSPSLAAGNDSLRTYQLEDVLVKEKRRPAVSRSATPVQILTHKELANLTGTQLSDAVRRFSGIAVKDYGGIGGLKTVSIRSMGAQHTGVTYDGIPVSDCQSGQVDISRFSLAGIAELSLTIGQSDDIYQSAKTMASAGNLNIVTRNAFPDSSKKYQLQTNLSVGSYGLIHPTIFSNYRFSDKLALSAHVDYLRANGEYPFSIPSNNRGDIITGKRINSDLESLRSEINAFWTPTSTQDVKLKLYFYNSERGLPGAVIVDNTYSAERLFDRNIFAQAGYEKRFSELIKLKTAIKYNHSRNRDYKPESGITRNDRFIQNELYSTITALYCPIELLSLSLSEDFTFNEMENTLFNCPFPKRYTSQSAFALQYQTSRFTATASALYTFMTEKVKRGQRPDDRSKLSPAISMSVRPFAESAFRIRSSFKDIYRVPTFNDLYYLEIGNAGLKPETTRQANFGVTWSGSFPGIDYLFFSADGYYNRVKDKIVAEPTMFIWKMVNADEVETWGCDVNLNVEKKLANQCKVIVGAIYNFVHAVDISKPGAKNWKHQLPYTPKHSGNGFFQIETPWVNLGYNINYASVRYKLAQNTYDNRIAPYTDQSVSASRRLNFGKHTLDIKADINNIANVNYEVIRFYPMAPRSYRISLNYAF